MQEMLLFMLVFVLSIVLLAFGVRLSLAWLARRRHHASWPYSLYESQEKTMPESKVSETSGYSVMMALDERGEPIEVPTPKVDVFPEEPFSWPTQQGGPV